MKYNTIANELMTNYTFVGLQALRNYQPIAISLRIMLHNEIFLRNTDTNILQDLQQNQLYFSQQ